MSRSMKNIIIDLDAGVDDAYALLMFLNAEKEGHVKIQAIVCSSGNARVDYVCRNVIRLLELAERTDIPVYRGVGKPLIETDNKLSTPHEFGTDGFGDLEYETEPDMTILKTDSAIVALNEIVSRFSKNITLICLAPLTNVALAMKVYDNFSAHLREMYFLGGNYTAEHFVDNTSEFNVFCDPEAMCIVLQNVQCPLKILPLETCMEWKCSYKWRFEKFSNKTCSYIPLLNRVEETIQSKLNLDCWMPFDAFLAAIVIYPHIILQQAKYNVSVELNSCKTRGQLILKNYSQGNADVSIIQKINFNYIKDIFVSTL